ncbi:MAG: sulfur oxidation protein SoxY [Rubrivivax sp.]|jgi:sulfur-oxidizing protein SoxY|nr:sulfur oxidation protein SoxY [Rubrivivax sp.]
MTPSGITRRTWGRQQLLRTGTVLGAAWTLQWRPAAAQVPPAWQAALRQLTGAITPQTGRVHLELAPLVENGNAVPVQLWADPVDTPATLQVTQLALLTERNPQPEVAVFHLSALSGQARVATRMRLATSQTVWALARYSDGSWWQQGADVVVTLAACVEGA